MEAESIEDTEEEEEDEDKGMIVEVMKTKRKRKETVNFDSFRAMMTRRRMVNDDDD